MLSRIDALFLVLILPWCVPIRTLALWTHAGVWLLITKFLVMRQPVMSTPFTQISGYLYLSHTYKYMSKVYRMSRAYPVDKPTKPLHRKNSSLYFTFL